MCVVLCIHLFIYICIVCLFLCSNNIVNMEQGRQGGDKGEQRGEKEKFTCECFFFIFLFPVKEEKLKQIVITVNKNIMLPTVAK